ncbi:MAG TPA: PRC-barrel domain-containing protein [Paenibacillus sp.]|uniref:PRC-barrel domain-containing protein n=1 Tax=Paenibacillus sp. TaxID=58172 RepID=UPI0028D55642|nr:PRC-barrel domain-containing protein [Paenibacillus sp.]HUC91354.1 PRC-barrel domain-containing protein [Paenibacillus sp.]
MYKLQNLIGLPVIDARTGRSAGNVLDVWFDDRWSLAGIVLKARRWWLTTFYEAVRWEHVQACGRDVVLISGKKAVCRLKSAEIGRAFHTGTIRMKDLPVVTEEGRQLGRVSDVYFQEKSGTPILGFELTDGFVSDLLEGRKWLKAPGDPVQVTLGDDAIVVPARCEEELEKIVTETGR